MNTQTSELLKEYSKLCETCPSNIICERTTFCRNSQEREIHSATERHFAELYREYCNGYEKLEHI